MNQVSFTIEELVTNKVASDTPAIRNIISPWQTAEFLKKIGLFLVFFYWLRRNAKSVNDCMTFQDIRLAFTSCPKIGISEFIKQKVRKCQTETCGIIYYRDFDRKQYACPNCNTTN